MNTFLRLFVLSIVIFSLPVATEASSRVRYSIGTQHIFSPYTYVAAPFVSVGLPGQGMYQYPMQTSSYTYPNQQMYSYSYPQYQTNYSEPNYFQSSYQPTSNYQPSHYQDYSYSSYPSYATSYMSGDEYCYSGYGCYPFQVDDPHQWIQDPWTGTWY